MANNNNETPLSLADQLDSFQVANYNLQPLLTVNINVEIPGFYKTKKFH